MKPPAASIHTTGSGPDLVLIHGTASDGSSWSVLRSLLRDRVRVTIYDRRGSASWPLPPDAPAPSIEDHAGDLADVLRDVGAASAYVFGASLGGAIAIEAVRRHRELIRGAVLFEPAIPADDRPPARVALLNDFETLLGGGDGPGAAEFFHRRVLSDAVWRGLPPEAQEQAKCMWKQIHCDLLAQSAYRVRYGELTTIDTPILLLGGGRSRPLFEPTLVALASALPRAERGTIEHAGHRISGRAWRELATALADFMGVAPA